MSGLVYLSALTLLAINPVFAQEKTNDNLPLVVTNPLLQYELGTFPKNAKWQSLSCKTNGCEIKNTQVKIIGYSE